MTSRAWLPLTVVATLAVMGGMVAWGLRERARAGETGLPRRHARGLGHVGADREWSMPEGCEVDPARPPKAVFDLKDDRLDFGPMRQGQVLHRDVVLRNVGTGPLCLSGKPQTGCGCVRAEHVGGRVIPPSSSATIRVTVDVGITRAGPQDKEVRLHTNDPGRRTAAFRVLADVRLGVVLEDVVAQFGRAMKGREATAVLRLRTPVEEPAWEVTGVQGAATAFTFTTEKAPSKDPAFRALLLRLRHPGSDTNGPQNDTVKIRTSHPEHPEIVVTTAVTVVDRYFASPPMVPFGLMAGETQGSWFPVRLIPAEPGGAVPVAGARVEGKGFEADDPTPAGSGEWVVRVRPDTHGLPAGAASATLVVPLDDAEMKEVRVPLKVDVLGPRGRVGIEVPPDRAARRR